MKWLIISDIHANLEALDIILLHSSIAGANNLIFTGDIVTFGPNPNECIEKIISVSSSYSSKYFVMGNNDLMISQREKPKLHNSDYERSVDWTNKTITDENRRILASFLHGPVIVDRRFTLVHGSFTDPIGINGYMDDKSAITASFSKLESPIGFFGHTHRPAIYIESKISNVNSSYEEIVPAYKEATQNPLKEFIFSYKDIFDQGRKIIINSGSAGHPRDGNPDAAYIILDDKIMEIHFYRTSYNVEQTKQKMRNAFLPENHIIDLGVGR